MIMFDDELTSIIRMSKFFGKNADMVQAGGGNTSVKLPHGSMYVKTSGSALGNANSESFICVAVNQVVDILNDRNIREMDGHIRDSAVSDRLSLLVTDGSGRRPSIEVFLHALLEAKYVVHIHPVYVNALTCIRGGCSLATELLGDLACFWIDFENPGYPLGISLQKGLERYISERGANPEIILLKNHGIIVSSNSEGRIYEIVEEAETRLRGFFGEPPFPVYSKFTDNDYQAGLSKQVLMSAFESLSVSPGVVRSIGSPFVRHILSFDGSGLLFKCPPLYPDLVVYCGEAPLCFEDMTDQKYIELSLRRYMDDMGYPPKVVVFEKDDVLLLGDTEAENDVMEETLEAHLKTLFLIKRKGQPEFLAEEVIRYLANWESEKYRRKLLSRQE